MLKGLLPLIVGAILGAVGGAWWMQRTLRHANEVVILQWAASEGQAAMEQYLFSKPEIASYALERYIAFLQPYRKSDMTILNNKAVNADLALALARLGLIEERLGRLTRASELYSTAQEIFQGTGKTIKTSDELKQIIERLDQSVRQTWGKKRAGS